MFVARQALPELSLYFGLTPALVFERLWLWQPLTYMFLHGGVFHVLFNMLSLWMFGTEFERIWGTRYFLWFYFATGLAAAATTLVASLLPFSFADVWYQVPTIGASGSIYGLLVAYGLYFPDRPIYMYLVFPIPAKYFVLLIGAITFLASDGGGVAHAAHLGGAVGGYLLLKGYRGISSPIAELKYRYLRWKLGRAKRRFDVHTGGRRDDWDRRIH
jgi:membrane associated rhomboid family serine protease